MLILSLSKFCDLVGVLYRLSHVDVGVFDRVGNLSSLAFVLSDFLCVAQASLLLRLLLNEVVTGTPSRLVVRHGRHPLICHLTQVAASDKTQFVLHSRGHQLRLVHNPPDLLLK